MTCANSNAILYLVVVVSALAGVGTHNSAILLVGMSLAIGGGVAEGITRSAQVRIESERERGGRGDLCILKCVCACSVCVCVYVVAHAVAYVY